MKFLKAVPKTLAAIVAVTLLGVAACANDEDADMPDVMNERLDVALSDIDRAGFSQDDVEVVGGGMFGVVDETNWQVCEQEPAAGEPIGSAPRLVVDRECKDADQSEPEPDTAADEDDPTPTYLILRVVDGDTVELEDGEGVRLVGIDAPEDGACGSLKAKEKLVSLLEGRQVLLTQPGDDRDRYDRMLRYVDHGSVDAGLEMIQAGLAIARYDSRDGYGAHPRENQYVKADRGAKDVDCTPAPPPPPPPPPSTKPPKQFADAPSNCEPGYSPCVPTYPPDLDCADTGPVSVTGSDPHGLDADGDGVACGGD